MSRLIHVVAILTLGVTLGATTASLAQQTGGTAPRPAAGMGSKTIASCSQDTRKYCSTAPGPVLTECLVKNWDRISGDCQDALGTPLRPRRGVRRVQPTVGRHDAT